MPRKINESSVFDSHFVHFVRRVKERYGIKLSRKDYDDLVKEIRTNDTKYLFGLGENGRQHRLVKIQKNYLYVIYDPKFRTLVTALDGRRYGIRNYIGLPERYSEIISQIQIGEVIRISTDEKIYKYKVYTFRLKIEGKTREIDAVCVYINRRRYDGFDDQYRNISYCGVDEMLKKYGLKRKIKLYLLVRIY